MTTSTSAIKSASASTSTFSAPDLLPFSSALCDHVPDGHPMTQDLKTLYSMHLTGDAKALRCNWFTQAKRAQENYHLRKHELEVKNKLKEEMKQLTKQKEKTRIAAKRAEGYTCRRCKTVKFDSNTKLHEHIRTRHAKEAEACSSQPAVNCFIFFRIETPYAASIGNLLIAHVTETLISLDAYTRNCTRAFRERITYSSSFRTRILVGCNIKKIDILGRNCLTANHCTEALSSPDCDTQIGVQTLGEDSSQLPAYSTAYSASSTYTIEALSHCGRPVPHVC
ncbi:hypothetical protein G7Y79_00062g093340 [Physcia stellaris]|nr:hypothetical protein G7Y79_00062g093340 [Physcia stellaris]